MQKTMNTKNLLFSIFTILATSFVYGQLIPDITGYWTVYEQTDICNTTLDSSDISLISIENIGLDSDFDTVLIEAHKADSTIESLVAFLEINISDSNIINVHPISGTLFGNNWKHFELNTADSLTFSWSGACNGCSCGNKYKSLKDLTSNNVNTKDFQLLKFFPNPVKEKLYIQINSRNDYQYNLKIYTLNGKLILSSILDNELNLIDLPDIMNSGTYVYVLIKDGIIYNTGKILRE